MRRSHVEDCNWQAVQVQANMQEPLSHARSALRLCVEWLTTLPHSSTHIALGLKQLLGTLLVHLAFELAQAGDNLPSLVTEKPREVAILDGILLAVFGCRNGSRNVCVRFIRLRQNTAGMR